MPTLEAWKGLSGVPAAAKGICQAPSDPKRAQLAPPSARISAPAVKVTLPAGVSNRCCASVVSGPVHRWRRSNITPSASNRANHARRRGEAFMQVGKIRPVLPVKTSCPSASAKPITSSGPNCNRMGFKAAVASKCCKNAFGSSALVRLRPDFPAIRNFRAGEGIASATATRNPARAACSAAIKPAGPAPTTNTSNWSCG